MKPVEEFIYRMKFNAKTMTVDVEQVGELIRCKECAYWNAEEQHGCTHDMLADDYCSRAERKEE